MLVHVRFWHKADVPIRSLMSVHDPKRTFSQSRYRAAARLIGNERGRPSQNEISRRQCEMAVKRDGEIGLGVAVHISLDDGLRRRKDVAQVAGVVAPFGANEDENRLDAESSRDGVDCGEIDELARAAGNAAWREMGDYVASCGRHATVRERLIEVEKLDESCAAPSTVPGQNVSPGAAVQFASVTAVKDIVSRPTVEVARVSVTQKYVVAVAAEKLAATVVILENVIAAKAEKLGRVKIAGALIADNVICRGVPINDVAVRAGDHVFKIEDVVGLTAAGHAICRDAAMNFGVKIDLEGVEVLIG